SKTQIYVLHRHIVHALSLNTTSYFEQLNLRLAFAPLLSRTRQWGEQVAILNNALVSSNDFACIALLDSQGKEKAKAFNASLTFWAPEIDYSRTPLFQKLHRGQTADMGNVYE